MEHKKRNNRQKRPYSSTDAKNKLIQPVLSGIPIDNIPIDEYTGEDFETLMNAPISEGGHFVFKSEKDWTIDVPQFSEYFTLDLKILSQAINCIPFNKCINIDDKYCTIDQLTRMQNATEAGKKNYQTILDNLNTAANLNNCNKDQNGMQEIKENEQLIDMADSIEQLNVHTDESDINIVKTDSEDELDFLLSLKEPTSQNVVSVPSVVSMKHLDDSTVEVKPNTTTKPEDLEKWLDELIDS